MPDPEVLRYAAFSTDPSGGNPAGVVLDARGLDDDAMLAIAAEVGYSETAFLVDDSSSRQLDVRYFSPVAEVPFCGHATIAAAVAVAERSEPGDLVLTTRAGTVPVRTERTSSGRLSATLTSVEPGLYDVTQADVDEALKLLRWERDELDPTIPPAIAFAGARHLVLAAATRERLARLDYEFDGLAAFMSARDLTTVQLVWRQEDRVLHVRNPFPVGGVVEDPATGAAAAALGHYLRGLGLVASSSVLTLHQGADMGRPGVLQVELRDGDPRVRVTGTAVRIP